MFYRGLDRERACTRLTKTVDRHDGAVIALVGGAELGRHSEFVVKVGKGGVGVFRPGIQDPLRGLLDFRPHFFCGSVSRDSPPCVELMRCNLYFTHCPLGKTCID